MRVEEDFEAWVREIDLAAKRAVERKRTASLTPLARAIDLMSTTFHSEWVQGFFGILIAANFFVNMAEAEIVPAADSSEEAGAAGATSRVISVGI